VTGLFGILVVVVMVFDVCGVYAGVVFGCVVFDLFLCGVVFFFTLCCCFGFFFFFCFLGFSCLGVGFSILVFFGGGWWWQCGVVVVCLYLVCLGGVFGVLVFMWFDFFSPFFFVGRCLCLWFIFFCFLVDGWGWKVLMRGVLVWVLFVLGVLVDVFGF